MLSAKQVNVRKNCSLEECRLTKTQKMLLLDFGGGGVVLQSPLENRKINIKTTSKALTWIFYLKIIPVFVNKIMKAFTCLSEKRFLPDTRDIQVTLGISIYGSLLRSTQDWNASLPWHGLSLCLFPEPAASLALRSIQLFTDPPPVPLF